MKISPQNIPCFRIMFLRKNVEASATGKKKSIVLTSLLVLASRPFIKALTLNITLAQIFALVLASLVKTRFKTTDLTQAYLIYQ